MLRAFVIGLGLSVLPAAPAAPAPAVGALVLVEAVGRDARDRPRRTGRGGGPAARVPSGRDVQAGQRRGDADRRRPVRAFGPPARSFLRFTRSKRSASDSFLRFTGGKFSSDGFRS